MMKHEEEVYMHFLMKIYHMTTLIYLGFVMLYPIMWHKMSYF